MIDVLVFIYGLILGSFFNVLIYRLPLNISILNPKRSFCISCNKQIKWYENIPILSYILLKGECSNCKVKISILYPIIELTTAITTILLFHKLELNLDFFIILLLFYTLIILLFIDFKYKAVPDYLLLIALLLSFLVESFSFKNALLFAGGFSLLNFFITYYIQNIKSKLTSNDDLREQTALGEGDIPIVAIIGGILNIKLALTAIFLSAIFAIIPSIYSTIKNNDIETPFIPYLVLGLFCCFIFDNQIINILNGILQ